MTIIIGTGTWNCGSKKYHIVWLVSWKARKADSGPEDAGLESHRNMSQSKTEDLKARMQSRADECLSLSRGFRLLLCICSFQTPRPMTWMMPSHLGEGHLLYSVY